MTIVFVLFVLPGFSQANPDTTAEAEDGIRSDGVRIANSIAGFSGTMYVTHIKSGSYKITLTMDIVTGGFYTLKIRY